MTIADVLNDTWNYINERAKKSSDAARAATGITDADGVLDIARKTARANVVPESQRQLGIVLPETAATFAAAPTGLYGLADAATQWATGGKVKLPGGEGAMQITKDIRDPVREVSNAVVGKPVTDDLLSGSLNDLVANWSRLGLAAGATVNPSAIAAIPGATKVAAAVDELGALGKGAMRTLEVLSPAVISKNPTPLLIGANTAVAAGLGVGIEAVLGGSANAQDTKQKVDSFAKGTADAAAEGIKEAQTVQPPLPTGDFGWKDAAAFGLLGAAALSFYKRDVAYRALTGLRQGEDTTMPLGTIIKEQMTDAAAPIHQAVREFVKRGGNKNASDVADAFQSRTAERYGAAIDTKLQQLYEFGELPASNIKITPINDVLTKFRAASPEDQAAAIERLNVRHEIDTRQRIATRDINGLYVTPGQQGDALFQGVTRMKGWDDSKVAYHMGDISTADLYRRWNNPTSPNAAALADEYLATLRKIPDYLYEQRALTKKEMLDLKKQNPNYVATKLAEGRSHLGELDPQAGKGLLDPGNPFEELPKYFDEIVRFVEANKIRREFLGTMIRAADAGDSLAKRYIGRKDMRLDKSAHAGDLNVRFRDFDGRARDVEVLDPVLRRALQNVGRPAALSLISGNNKFLSGSARFFENAAVGPLAAITGTIFAPVSAAYSMVVGTAMRDKRYGAAGWLDKAVQNLTGGKIGVRGDVLTLAPDAAFRAAQGVSAVFAQRASRVLRDSVLSDGRLSKMLGPQSAQVVADSLSNYFKKSWVSELQQRGQLGPASLTTIDPAKRFLDAKKMLDGVGPLGQAGGLIGDILHAVSAAPAASLYAMNKNQAAWKTNKLAREFSGDPSKSGAFSSPVFRKVGGVTAVTPWGNIFIQANARLAKAFRDNPQATTVGIFNSVAMPAILGTIHNATLGPEYTDYQYNVRSPDRQAGYLYVAIPGRPPEQGLEIPIDPLMRPFKHGAELLAGANLGLLDGTLFKEGNESARIALQAVSGHRQTSFGEGTVPTSLLQQSVLPPIPPIAGAIGAAAGVKIRSYVDSQDIKAGHGGFTESEGKNPHRSFMGIHEAAQMEEIVAAIGADAGRFIYNTMMDAGQAGKEGKKVGEIAGQTGNRVSQRLGDSTKYMSGPLFESFQAISPSTETSAVEVKRRLDSFEKIRTAYQDTTEKGAAAGNFIGSPKRGYTQGLGQAPQAAVDTEMLKLAEIVHRFSPQLNQEFLGTNKDLFALRSQVANSTSYSPQAKRALMNGYAEQIIDNNRAFLNRLQMIESNLSTSFGRQIKLDRIDLSKGIDQFKPLTNSLQPSQVR